MNIKEKQIYAADTIKYLLGESEIKKYRQKWININIRDWPKKYIV